MSVHNGEKYLHHAIQSILDQTFINFEFIIVDDGSTDGSWQILSKYQNVDARIHLLKNNGKKGLSSSLNLALGVSMGDLIARMDSDDVSHPQRLEKQIRIFEENSDVLVIGTAVDVIDSSGIREYSIFPPEDGRDIYWAIATGAKIPFIHPSVMFRKDLFTLTGKYNEDYLVGQDYELWSRLLLLDISEKRVMNLKEKLVAYRIHQKNVSSGFRDAQIYKGNETRHRIAANFINRINSNGLKFQTRKIKENINDELFLAKLEMLTLCLTYFSSYKKYPGFTNIKNFLYACRSLATNIRISRLLEFFTSKEINLGMVLILITLKIFRLFTDSLP